jgi:hypothetical protein
VYLSLNRYADNRYQATLQSEKASLKMLFTRPYHYLSDNRAYSVFEGGDHMNIRKVALSAVLVFLVMLVLSESATAACAWVVVRDNIYGQAPAGTPVYVDGFPRGYTDSSGGATIQLLTVGTHTFSTNYYRAQNNRRYSGSAQKYTPETNWNCRGNTVYLYAYPM